jgi:hypothetical protein
MFGQQMLLTAAQPKFRKLISSELWLQICHNLRSMAKIRRYGRMSAISTGRGLSTMPSNFTQTRRDLLNNVKQAVELVDKELQRIREQRIAICLSGFELHGRLTCIGTMQRANEANKLDSMVGAHTDFQAALKEIHGTQSQASVNESSGTDPPLFGLATDTPGRVGDGASEGRHRESPCQRAFSKTAKM